MSGPGKRPIYAVVDVGSKSIRLLVARRTSPAAFEVVDEERFDARLGEEQADGVITAEAVERGLHAMRVVAQVANSYSPEVIHAVGTEALRSATNAGEFVSGVYEQTGIQVRIISAQEEAFASYLGTINATRLSDGAIIDIGGGSLELMRVSGRKLRTARSVPLGAIYATERYLPGDPPTPREMRALRKAVRKEMGDIAAGSAPGDVLWATGGAVRNLARMIRLRKDYPLRRLHGFAFSRADLKRLLKELVRVPVSERRRLPGMNTARAGTLPAVAIIVDELMALLDTEHVRVSGQGLREGLAWQLMRGGSPLLPDVRAASIAGLAAANGVDLAGSEQEVRFAGELFETTAALHGLGHPELELLVSATRLSEIGMHIDYYNRDRHAEYLVHSGDLHGFSHREIVLLAAIVRHHTGGTPDLSPYAAVLHDGDASLVALLAAMLGISRAITRRPASPVFTSSITLDDGGVEIVLESQSSLEAELHALERPMRRLEHALGVPVRSRAVALPGHRFAELA